VAAQPRAEEPPRGRFGLGSLIGRMAGQGAASAAPEPASERAARAMPPARDSDYDDANHDNDRIEIPAFLRRQAN
jgi:cell division protein FtsZ